MTPVLFYIYYLFPHGTSINTKSKKSNVWIFFLLLQTNGEITPILNPGKKVIADLYMWVFLFLFSIQQQKDTQSIEGVTFSSLFYSNFPLVMDQGYPVLEVYRIEKKVILWQIGKKYFLHFLAKFIGKSLLHAFSKGA